MPRIKITHCSHEDSIALQLGEQRIVLNPKAAAQDVPDHFLPLLDASHIEYERLADEAEGTVVAAAEGAGEASGDVEPASDPLDHDGDGKKGGSPLAVTGTLSATGLKKKTAKKK